MAIISLIAAMDKNGLIGKDNKLPWHIPEDLKWFKEKTMGKTIIMGRKTHESIGKWLPGRLNVVITSNKGYESPYPYGNAVVVLNSVQEVLDSALWEMDELIIIGGAELYTSAFSFVNRMYLTKIHKEFEGDTYFPEYDKSLWETKEIKTIQHEDYLIDFQMLEKIQ